MLFTKYLAKSLKIDILFSHLIKKIIQNNDKEKLVFMRHWFWPTLGRTKTIECLTDPICLMSQFIVLSNIFDCLRKNR